MSITAITSNTANHDPVPGDFTALLTPVQADSVPAHRPSLQTRDPDHQNRKPAAKHDAKAQAPTAQERAQSLQNRDPDHRH